MPHAGTSLKADKPVIGDIMLKLLVDSTSLPDITAIPELKALTKDACRVLITHDKLVLERIAKEVALVEAQMRVKDTETQMHQARAAALEAEARVLEAEARVLEAEARVLEAKHKFMDID
ncbi:hypothetical protein HYPSUDRAFT_198620 [Hypholoma sublateritium FD-334 SS-4]|uniref:Uncharacterized protein n=1 Tax=Hypholoma sublateritium (strain FD-334 SS-4) TaxID=945553 RepID=A0A0D2P787_HYPSF|nr:hypothetical protein HYPSUDRAFT_198620 [Hypholoma sublateritium FD-334 SS-4]